MLEINTLSSPEIVVGNEKVVKFITRKALALVVYLAVNPGTRSREELADLLWSDQSQESAARNLRVVLSDIRKKIGNYLSIDRHSVSLSAVGDIWVDVNQLSDALQTKDLDLAISLYKGDFLESFYLKGARRFENWQVIEREKIRLELIDGLSEQIQSLLKAGRSKEAIKYLILLTTLEPLMESAHRQLMQAYFENGEIPLALRQFEICRQTLSEELSVTPTEKTLTLYSYIVGHQSSKEHGSRIPHNLPNFTTPFIGQNGKIRELVEILSNPDLRHLSLSGPGGYGKSRLAIHLAKKVMRRFPDGAFWVPLGSLEKSSELPQAVAESIGFIYHGEKDIKSDLLDHLRSKRMLLIFDNFEHLLQGASLVSEIQTASQFVKVISTSRQRLNLKGETVYLVGGMDVPVDDGLEFEKISPKRFDSLQLFIKAALRSTPSFSPKNEDLETIARICRLVDGMPLAIELAAGWVPVLPLVEIEREIKKGFEFLAGELRDVEERHQSLQAVAEGSWSLLTEAEESVFKRLSVLKGPFSRRAAQEFTGAKMVDLLSLSNKSFLQKDSEGLLRIHEWLRGYGERELGKSEVELSETKASFSGHYISYLSENWWEAWSGECQHLRLEWTNISEAMLVAAGAGDFRLLGKGLLPFFFASYVGEDYSKSAALFRQLVAEFERWKLSDKDRQTFALCLVFCAYFLRTQHRHDSHDQVEKMYSRAEKLLLECDLGLEHAWVRIIQCLDECYLDSEIIHKFAHQALEIFTYLEDDYALAFAYNLLACESHGDEKRKFCQCALAHARKHNGTRDIAAALLEMGRGEIEARDLGKAEKYTSEALSLYTKIRSLEGLVIANEYMGIVTHCQGRYSKAEEYYQTAYFLCDRVGWKSRIEIYELLLGSISIALQDYKIGRQFVLDSTSSRIEKLGQKMHVWVAPPEVSSLLERMGNPELAVISLVKSLEFPGPEFKPRLEKLFEEYKSRYPREEMSRWVKRANHMKPFEMATAIRDVLSEN